LPSLGVGDESCQRSGVHHPRLVDQEDRFARQTLAAVVLGPVQLQEQAGDARSGQAFGSHDVRRAPGRRCGAQLDPRLRPALGCGDDGEGLTATRLADHHGDSLGARQETADHLALVGLQGRASADHARRDQLACGLRSLRPHSLRCRQRFALKGSREGSETAC